MLCLLPSARVGHVGLYRDPKTLVAVEYYFKVPKEMTDRDAIIVDPMLATGNSAVAAVDRLKDTHPIHQNPGEGTIDFTALFGRLFQQPATSVPGARCVRCQGPCKRCGALEDGLAGLIRVR